MSYTKFMFLHKMQQIRQIFWISEAILLKITITNWAIMASLVAQLIKNLLAVQETQVRSLSWDDPLKMEMATHSCILAWEIPWT